MHSPEGYFEVEEELNAPELVSNEVEIPYVEHIKFEEAVILESVNEEIEIDIEGVDEQSGIDLMNDTSETIPRHEIKLEEEEIPEPMNSQGQKVVITMNDKKIAKNVKGFEEKLTMTLKDFELENEQPELMSGEVETPHLKNFKEEEEIQPMTINEEEEIEIPVFESIQNQAIHFASEVQYEAPNNLDPGALQYEAPSTLNPGHPGAPKRRNYNASEYWDMWNFEKTVLALGTHAQCVKFAEDKELIPVLKLCGNHRKAMYIRESGPVGFFVCKRSCPSKQSRANNTWFENLKFPLPVLFRLMYCFAADYSNKQTIRECVTSERFGTVSETTVTEWFNYCRETLVIHSTENYKGKIGGVDKIVQVNKCTFGVKKYGRSRTQGHWVLGMVEKSTDNIRIEVCSSLVIGPKIITLIKKHVEEGSTIHTENWKALFTLPVHGYNHRIVHKNDVENPFTENGSHTKAIENLWQDLKKTEENWRSHCNKYHLDTFEELLKCIRNVYKI